MDKKSKYLSFVFTAVMVFAIGFSFFKYYIFKDYYITLESKCDPAAESCFVHLCDPQSDEACPKDSEEQISYYKLVQIKAYDIPVCGSGDQDCSGVSCDKIKDCREIFCDPETVGEDESCSLPQGTGNDAARDSPDD